MDLESLPGRPLGEGMEIGKREKGPVIPGEGDSTLAGPRLTARTAPFPPAAYAPPPKLVEVEWMDE